MQLSALVADAQQIMVRAIGQLGRLSRPAIRARFEERFSARAMAREYCTIYRRLISLQSLDNQTFEAA